jgi:hypothetical protein
LGVGFVGEEVRRALAVGAALATTDARGVMTGGGSRAGVVAGVSRGLGVGSGSCSSPAVGVICAAVAAEPWELADRRRSTPPTATPARSAAPAARSTGTPELVRTPVADVPASVGAGEGPGDVPSAVFDIAVGYRGAYPEDGGAVPGCVVS